MLPAPHDPRQDPRLDPRFGPPPPRPGSSSDHRPRYLDPRAASGPEVRPADPRSASGSDALRQAALHGQRSLSASDHLRGPPLDPRLIPSGPDLGRALQSSGQDLRDVPIGPAGLVGRRLGPYRITAMIAQGGMGTVYEAIHERLQRAVALKTLLPGSEATGEDVQRFLNEARAAARLSHRNIVPIHDVGEAAGVRYLAMELVRGETLHALVRRTGPLDERRALEIVAGAADGLEHAHQSGIVHRDLKPANILLDADGTPRVTDFGVAKARGNQRLTATGTALGTPSYMSPEQAMGQNESLDARSDVYGLGAILYECLTGRPPFELATHLQTMQAVVSDPPTPPSRLRPGLSPEVEAICLKCLEKKRENRYASCRELAEDLRRCLAGRTVAARPPTRLALFLRRARRWAAAASAVVALGVGLALGLALGVAPRWVAGRRAERLERAAVRAVEERLARAEATLAAPEASREALREVAGLSPKVLERAALEALSGEHPDGAAAAARAAAAVDPATLPPLRAGALLRLADGAAPEERDALLAEVERLDPDGEAGRTARAETALALSRAGGAGARALALEELQALARTLDEPGRRAGNRLLQLLADQGRWSEVLGHAARLRAAPGAAALAPEGARLAELAAALAPSMPLPAADHVFVGRTTEGPVLFFVRGGDVWGRRLLPDDGPEAIAHPKGDPSTAEPIRLAAPWDRDGDGNDELLLITARGGLGTVRVTGAARVDWGPSITDLPNALATGDIDGDGHGDAVLTFWENGNSSLLIFGNSQQGTWQFKPMFTAVDPARRYSINAVAVADLDGDGRGEVVVGGSQFSQVVEVLAWSAEQGLVSRARIPAGVVRDLVPYPAGPEGRRQGVLVVVDAGRDDAERDLGGSTWLGRDGVLLIEASGDPATAAVVGRWTYGPDERPSAASRTLAEDVQGFVLPLGGVPHVGRAARVDGRGWTLELAPRDALSLAANAAPVVGLTADAPPAPRRLRAIDVDGDGGPEVILGASLLGFGPPPRAGDPYEGRPAPRPESPAERALRVSRKLAALGRTTAVQDVVAALRRDHADSWAASAAALLLVDAELEAARLADEEARRAFARLEADVGARRRADARRAWAAAGASCAELAGSGELSPRDALAAWERAADAFERAGDRAAAVDALERAAGTPALDEATAARLRARADALRRLAALAPLDLDLQQAQVRSALLVNAPLRCSVLGPAVALRCAPDSEEWAVVPLDLQPALPLVLEATLRLHGHCWATHAEAGLFEPRPDALGPERLTGLRIGLWDVATGKADCRVMVAGQPVGPAVRLPTFEETVSVRLELTPLERGGVRARAQVTLADGRVVLDDDATLDVSPGQTAFAGLRSPAHRGSEAMVEQALWAMDAQVTLERLRVSAARARWRPVEALEGAHAALALDDAAAARRAYDQRLRREGDAEALFHRGLARGRLGDPEAAEDIVEAARRAPYRTILWLEDAADVLPGAHPGYVAAIGSALRAMAASPRPLPQALGRQLLGDLDGLPDRFVEDVTSSPTPGAEAEVQEAAAYLTMRAPHDPQRWRWFASYQRAAPGGRYPRRALPRIIPAAADPERERAEVEALLEQDRSCLLERHRVLSRARLAGVPSPERAALLYATFLSDAGAHGMAERAARELLARVQGRDPTSESSALVLLVRSYAAQRRVDELDAALRRLRGLGAMSGPALDELERTARARLGVVGPALQDPHR